MDARRVLGTDAAGSLGWVGVLVEDGRFAGARVGTFREIVEWSEPVGVIGIDIPIGHVPGGVRRCDFEARAFVGPRRSSVFAAPPAEVLTSDSYASGNAALTSLGRPKLSRQAWALIPKIVEVEQFAASDERIHEVHPEVSFCALAGSHLPWSKKSWNGLALRRRLLAAAGIELPDEIPEVAGVAADDLLDAAVVAWSAARIAAGQAHSLPDPPEMAGSRPVAIWY